MLATDSLVKYFELESKLISTANSTYIKLVEFSNKFRSRYLKEFGKNLKKLVAGGYNRWRVWKHNRNFVARTIIDIS